MYIKPGFANFSLTANNILKYFIWYIISINLQVEHFTMEAGHNGRRCSMLLYLPCRTAQVLAKIH
jgi:hypothetical protein